MGKKYKTVKIANASELGETKWCPRGQHDVPISGFTKHSKRKDGLASYCKSCRRKIHVTRFYNLTEAEYIQMKADQANCCAICGKPPKSQELSVDHDHETGEVRGLLCTPCNRAIGFVDKIDWFKSACKYLGYQIVGI